MTHFSALMERQFIRFLFVGIINAIFGYGVFAVFLYVGLHYTLALLMATILGVLFNFKSTGALIFKSDNNQLIFRFILCYAFIYFINISGIKILSYVGFSPYVAGAILILPMAALAFVLNKRFVFHHG